jgi:hypothetical protein
MMHEEVTTFLRFEFDLPIDTGLNLAFFGVRDLEDLRLCLAELRD